MPTAAENLTLFCLKWRLYDSVLYYEYMSPMSMSIWHYLFINEVVTKAC